jgi:hypothetical protein
MEVKVGGAKSRRDFSENAGGEDVDSVWGEDWRVDDGRLNLNSPDDVENGDEETRSWYPGILSYLFGDPERDSGCAADSPGSFDDGAFEVVMWALSPSESECVANSVAAQEETGRVPAPHFGASVW